MKKLIITLALIAGVSAISNAQQASIQNAATPTQSMTPEQAAQREANMKKQAEAMAERQTKDMQQKLGLSDDQYKKALAVNQEFFTKMIASRSSAVHPTPQQNQELMAEKNTKLKAILTPEQAQKFEATQPQHMQHPAPAPQPANK